MIKTIFVGTILTVAAVWPALAQDAPTPPQGSSTDGGAGVRSGHITSTGETVPNPGEPQSGGTTSMDRGIQAQDNKIQGSICKGC